MYEKLRKVKATVMTHVWLERTNKDSNFNKSVLINFRIYR